MAIKFLKWVEIIELESEAVKRNAMYILQKDAETCDVIFVDSKGSKRKASGITLTQIEKQLARIDATNIDAIAQEQWRSVLNLYTKAEVDDISEELRKSISDESTSRQSADTNLQQNIDAEIQARANADNLKLDKPTTTVTAPNSTYKWVSLLNDTGDTVKMLAGDLGKNIANSSLTSISGAGMTQGASYTWNAANYPFNITGLPDKSTDSTFNLMLTTNTAGQIAISDGKQVLVGMPSLLSEAEKTAWKTEMNVGNDTLESVVHRGNYTPKPIKFGDPASPYYFGINNQNSNLRISKTSPETDTGTGRHNIGIGFGTLPALTTGAYNIAIGGWAAGKISTGEYNNIIGVLAGSAITSGSYNCLIGGSAGRALTSGINNVMIGISSGIATATGNLNVFVGRDTGLSNTTGYKNTYIGSAAGYHATGNLNTIIGYKAGYGAPSGDRNILIGAFAGEGVNGINNILIGAGAGSSTGVQNFNNKLIIHNNHTWTQYNETNEGIFGSPQQGSVDLALVVGDFVQRWFKLNGTFKVANGYMAEVGGNAALTSVVMYNPTTEEFGKANILDLPFIPLSGTTAGKPVTGKIEFSVNGGGTIESGVAKLSLTDGYIQLVSGILKGFYINPEQTMLRHGNLKYINLSNEFDYIVISAEADGPGLVSPYYYGDQYVENSFIQKKYSDLQHSFTTSEKRTQGTWIDGKPVYQITLELTNIPRSGIVNLTGLVPGISRIVASDVFTEWSSLNLVFAGQVYRNDDVNVSINITPLELRIKNFITDVGYENIDRILLTIQYTKTED